MKGKTYARVGRTSDLDAKIAEARSAGATITKDPSARTVVATLDGQELFRAMGKGGGMWVILYSEKFYPRTA
jgi:hypothetical protein